MSPIDYLAFDFMASLCVVYLIKWTGQWLLRLEWRWWWRDLMWRLCEKIGHIESPPYYYKCPDAWPRCRRCKTRCVALH